MQDTTMRDPRTSFPPSFLALLLLFSCLNVGTAPTAAAAASSTHAHALLSKNVVAKRTATTTTTTAVSVFSSLCGLSVLQPQQLPSATSRSWCRRTPPRRRHPHHHRHLPSRRRQRRLVLASASSSVSSNRMTMSSSSSSSSPPSNFLESPSAERNKGPIWDVIQSRVALNRASNNNNNNNNNNNAVFRVLEVAAGAGVHTRHFVRQYLKPVHQQQSRGDDPPPPPSVPTTSGLLWYPSDPSPVCLESQRAYRDDPGLDDDPPGNNGGGVGGGSFRQLYRMSIRDPLPLTLDETGIQEADTVRTLRDEASGGFNLILCINMIHIAPWSASIGLFRVASQWLRKAREEKDDEEEDGRGGGVLLLYGPFRVKGTMVESNQRFDEWLKMQDSRYGVRNLEDVCELAADAGLRLTDVVEMPANNLAVLFRPKP